MKANVTWGNLTKEQLAQRFGQAVSMLYKIASEKEVWTVGQVRRLLNEITADGKEGM